MTIGFKDSRISSEGLCLKNAEFKYLTVTLLLTSSQYLHAKSICPFLETSLNVSLSDTIK